MIETQQRQMVQEYAQRLQYQGISFKQYMQFTGLTREDLMEQVKPQVMRRIQSRLILEAVAEAEKLEATEEEIDEELKKMSEAYGISAEEAESSLGANGRRQIKEDICVRKAAELVAESAEEV